jgi:DNA-binding winged helix-turn-helix (wHTH) protein/TolB-like protein/Flp pilus assembly protein TadD
MSQPTDHIYEFGPFRLDALRRVLLRDGQPVCLTAKVFDTLLVFVERRGRVLHKDELMAALWPDTTVEENNLTQHVSMLRKTLGERAGEHRYVVTVPGRGYSFVADVRAVAYGEREVLLEEHTSEHITIDVEEEQAEAERTETAAPQTATAAPRTMPAADAGAFVALAARGGATAGSRPRRSRSWRALVVCVVALTLAAGYYLWSVRAQRSKSAQWTPKSIAVLPFQTLGAAADDLTGVGMADALTARLSNVRQIAVRPTSAVIKYEGRSVDTLAAGRTLGVDAIVEGTVQRAGDRVRVTVQLVSVGDGEPVWGASFDERFTDIFALQDSISEQVARALLPRLSGEDEQRIRRHATESVAAYEAYLRGRHFWNKRNAASVEKSVEHFQRAIDLDPTYGAAYAGLADAYSVLAHYRYGSLPPGECMQRARAAALKAIEIDDTVAEAHASLALIKTFHEQDAASAENEFRRAIELNPAYATAHHWYSDFLATQGRTAEALAEAQRAGALDPLSPIISTTIAERFYFARRYDSAAEQLRRTLELDSDFIQARLLLGLVYGQQGRHAEALAELQRARTLAGGGDRRVAAALGQAYAVSGRREQARRLLGELSGAGEEAAPADVALVLASLGQKAQAYLWLQKASDKAKASPEVANMLKADPRFDSLRADPKFRILFPPEGE